MIGRVRDAAARYCAGRMVSVLKGGITWIMWEGLCYSTWLGLCESREAKASWLV